MAGMFLGLQGAVVAVDSLEPDDAKDDDDRDDLINLFEYGHGTDPKNADTDYGGCPDGWEVFYDENRAAFDFYSKDMLERSLWEKYARYDSDDDGLNDANVDPDYRFDPTCQVDEMDGSSGEVDSDLWSNLDEYRQGTDPTNPDTDRDGWEDSSDPEALVPSQYDPGPEINHQNDGNDDGRGTPWTSQGNGQSAQLGASWESFL